VASVQVGILMQPETAVHGTHDPGLPLRYDPAAHDAQSSAVGPTHVRHVG
jgi:hypothetical protein